MNSLSWFIYFAEVADNVKSGIQVMCGVSLFAIGGTAIPALIGKFDEYMGSGEFYGVWRPIANKVVPLALIGILVSGLMPSQRTLIMIAASELGERVAKSDQMQGVVNPSMDLIRKWIKQEADKIKEKS